LDTTNAVIIGSDGTNYPIKIKALSYGEFDWNAANVHGKSLAGTPYVEYTLIED
jgi:hypothetical protein